jgi:integrase
MSRSRPASSPVSFHKHTGQYYVTRGRRRIYLGADLEAATDKYHHLALGELPAPKAPSAVSISAKELANRFIVAQRANWRSEETLRGYENWLARFLRDHPGLKAEELTVERFAAWKMSLRQRGYSTTSINHFLKAVRTMYAFGEENDLIEKMPRLRRVKNEAFSWLRSRARPLYTAEEIHKLLAEADMQLRLMMLLGLNCGFGPKDVHDLIWDDIDEDRVTLPRSKTGVCQTFLLWPETRKALAELRLARGKLIIRLEKRGRPRDDVGRVFVTKYWRPWRKDAVAEQFRKLCKAADVPCYGFYRLRHCASTAVSLVANPHVQRRFMRHSQLQQQVTYTHTPDSEVDAAITKARSRLLGEFTEAGESDPQPVGAA